MTTTANEADHGTTLPEITHPELLRRLALQWKARREGLGLKVKTIAHAKAQLEFFVGAFSALEIAGKIKMNAHVLLTVSVREDMVKEFAPD